MEEERTWVLAFESTHAAMAAQSILAELRPYVIPTPRDITASCGMSIALHASEVSRARELLQVHADIVALSSWYESHEGVFVLAK